MTLPDAIFGGMTPEHELGESHRKWDMPVCADPGYCLSLDSTDEAMCEDLSKARTEDELKAQLVGSPREQFHAGANPYMSDHLRRIAFDLGSSAVYLGLFYNPAVTRTDLGSPSIWGSRATFLDLFLKRHDLIPASSLVGLAKTWDDVSSWRSMLEHRNIPNEAYEILLSSGSPRMRRYVAYHAKASTFYLDECLKLPTDEFYDPAGNTHYTRHPAVHSEALPVGTLLTVQALDADMEAQLLARIEERSDEVREWVQEWHPELANVPLEWVRLVLAGTTDE